LTPKALRLIGILFLFIAAVVAILNLKRVADLGMMWASPALLVIGAAFLTLSRRRDR
jgi:hypothetical protein